MITEIFNCEILFREDSTADELIDVIVKNRVYLPCLYIYNKIDQISLEEVDKLARQPNSVVVSCNMKLNLDCLLDTIWDYLALIQVYTKKVIYFFGFYVFFINDFILFFQRGEPPDFEDGLILRRNTSIEHVCHAIHRSILSQFKYALVWGTSTKYSPQRVGLSHVVAHEDVVMIVKK